MRVVFIHPHGSNWLGDQKDISSIFNLMPPLGMMSIAAVLEQNGIRVEIIDCYATPLTPEALVKKITDNPPDAVGFSCTTSSFLEGYRIAAMIKDLRPDIVTVVGGAHACTIGPALLDSYLAIDYLVIGEGEQTMLELALAGFKGAERYSRRGLPQGGRCDTFRPARADCRPGCAPLPCLPPTAAVPEALQPATVQLSQGPQHQHHLKPRLPLHLLILRPFSLFARFSLQFTRVRRGAYLHAQP